MFEVTREMFHQEMAEAVFDHLRSFLLEKENNHCQRVEFLPVEVMRMVCERIATEADFKKRGIEAYVLAEKATNALEIESGALIEKRNRQSFGVLLAFIPPGLRLPAEDSYDIQTFKTYELANALRAHARQMVDALPEHDRVIARTVLNQPSVKGLPVDQHIKYLLALKNDGAGWKEAGAYLFHLQLIPDLDLGEKTVQTRIDRNSKCVDAITDENQSTLSALEELAEKIQLEPQENYLRENIVAFLRTRNVAETDTWLREILADEDLRTKLNFAKWKFKDSPDEGTVEVHLDSLRNPKTGEIAKGFQARDSNLVASTDPRSPIHLKWKTYPGNAPNIGYYVVLVVRDNDDEEMGGELLRKTVKNSKKTDVRAKVILKDIELAEGEACAAKVIVQARDRSGVILSLDESESFWIEGGEQLDETKKKVNKVRNRAEAFFLGAARSRNKMEVDSEGWEEGRRSLLYRLKLKNRDIYHIVLNPVLHEIERRNISDPMNCGAWEGDLRNRGVLEADDLKPFPLVVSGLSTFEAFTDARKKLFNLFHEKDRSAAVEIFDLREFKADIIAYAQAYIGMLSEVRTKLKAATSDGQINNLLNASHKLSRLDTVHLKVGDSEGEDHVALLAPTHPIRLVWTLQYQQLLFLWAEKLAGATETEAAALVSREAHEKITSLNIPPALAFERVEIYVNTDNIDLYWSILPRGDTRDVRKTVSTVLRLLGYKLNQGEITVITAAQVADRIWRYLKHHPYVSTLRLNVINPGDGLLVLNAIREIQRFDEFKHLNYDVAFYADLRYEIMGSAFDEMTEGSTLSEGSLPDIDEELLRPNRNALFPKLTFSKRKLLEADWRYTELREAHITILIDRFSTNVLTRNTQPPPGSFCLHNLLSEYRTDFDLKGDSATWSRKITPNQNSELLPADTCAQSLFQSVDGLLRLAACYYDWGSSLDKAPAIQLELSETDKHLINHIHEQSDWVFTVDRNFGIEYFDNPRSGGVVRSYLIDYTPEFLDGVGHRLIISTFWLSEIEGIIFDGLKKMGVPGTGFHASQILDVLKSISGRLALKLINNPKDAREIIGLALTRLFLQEHGDLKSGILIPVDSHIDLFAEHKRTASDASIRLQRSDLILARTEDNKLVFRLIEVKYRSNAGGPGEHLVLKEAIAQKNADTRKVFEAKFVPRPEKDRLDRELQNKELANLLQFYLERSQRHGLIEDSATAAQGLRSVISCVEKGDFRVTFEKAGYIFHTEGVSKEPETFKDNQVFVIGRKEILDLLGIEDEPSEPLGSGPLPGTPPPPVPAGPQAGAPRPASPKPSSQQAVTSELVAAVARPQPATADQSEQFRVLLGKNTENDKSVFWDPFASTPKKLTNQHILIVGKSGAGKTQTASAFIWGLSKAGVPSIVFDFQGEYISGTLTNGDGKTFLECTNSKVLDAADGINVNPLEVPTDPHSGKKQTYVKVVYQVANSLAKIFGLGNIQHAILRDAITQSFVAAGFAVNDKESWNRPAPSFSSVWRILKQMEVEIGGNVRNLNLRIQPLFETGVFLEDAGPRGFEAVLAETHVLRLSNLATPELMVAVSRFALQKIYANMLAKGPSNAMRVFAVVDEAHKLSYEETLTELIREARKYGVGLLLASQSVKDFDRVVFDMVGTKIALQLEGEDAKVMSENLGLINKFERNIAQQLILNQAPHNALIRSNHFEPYVRAELFAFHQLLESVTEGRNDTIERTPAPPREIGNYDILEVIGSGAFGEVLKARQRQTSQIVALKVMQAIAGSQQAAAIRREFEALDRLSRAGTPGVVQVIDFIRDENQTILVLEYGDGGNLFEYVKKADSGKLPLAEVKQIMSSILDTLVTIHENGIIHRDLKPQNILCVAKRWKIADFGIAKYLPRPFTEHTLRGSHSPGYSAPEQIAGLEAAETADIFSIGKIILFMLQGSPDADGVRFIETWAIRNLIEACIATRVESRPTCIAEVRDRLKYVRFA